MTALKLCGLTKQELLDLLRYFGKFNLAAMAYYYTINASSNGLYT